MAGARGPASGGGGGGWAGPPSRVCPPHVCSKWGPIGENPSTFLIAPPAHAALITFSLSTPRLTQPVADPEGAVGWFLLVVLGTATLLPHVTKESSGPRWAYLNFASRIAAVGAIAGMGLLIFNADWPAPPQWSAEGLHVSPKGAILLLMLWLALWAGPHWIGAVAFAVALQLARGLSLHYIRLRRGDFSSVREREERMAEAATLIERIKLVNAAVTADEQWLAMPRAGSASPERNGVSVDVVRQLIIARRAENFPLVERLKVLVAQGLR